RVAALADAAEAVPLVEMERRIVRLDAEADPRVPLVARPLEERLEQLRPEALAALARHDRDRQLRRLLVDESEPALVRLEEPVPGRPDRPKPFDRDQARVAAP